MKTGILRALRALRGEKCLNDMEVRGQEGDANMPPFKILMNTAMQAALYSWGAHRCLCFKMEQLYLQGTFLLHFPPFPYVAYL